MEPIGELAAVERPPPEPDLSWWWAYPVILARDNFSAVFDAS